MIEILPAPDHVAAYRLDGRLTADDYDVMIADIEGRLARHEHLAVYSDASGFADMTPEAMAKDFHYSFSKVGQWSRFRRAAIVTDLGWMKALVKVFSPLVPGLDARAFEPGRQAEALAWVSEPSPD